MKIVLCGNPNVGKSVVFSYLTGYSAISSNYPGTTVELLKGRAKISSYEFEIIDLPGTYSIAGENKAEKVAKEIIEKGDYDLIIDVVDANNLERNLLFALELISLRRPLILLLNKCDIAKEKGVNIDFEKLEHFLGVRVIPVVATVGIGFNLLEREISRFIEDKTKYISNLSIGGEIGEKWKLIGEIISKVQKIEHKHPGFMERLEIITTTPSTAIPFGIFIMILSFYIIRFIGEGLINKIFDPLFNNFYMRVIEKLDPIIKYDILKFILFGKNPAPMEGFGVLTTGVYIPFVVVLPYIFSFYLVLSILEDIGYLPRLSVVLDRLSHKIGLHGYSTIPLIMGLGCKVPGIFSLRILETDREKLIAASLMFLIAPCMPQTAMIFSILKDWPLIYTIIVFGYIFMVGLIASFFLNKIMKGSSSDLFIEIPPYHKPLFKNLIFKLKLRIKDFIYDAVGMIILGIFLINIIDILGFMEKISSFFAPFFNKVLSLPSQIAIVMTTGFLRKDVSISMLIPFKLSLKEIMVSSFFLVSYLPCLSSMLVLSRELGKKMAAYVIIFNFMVSLIFAYIFSIILSIIL